MATISSTLAAVTVSAPSFDTLMVYPMRFSSKLVIVLVNLTCPSSYSPHVAFTSMLGVLTRAS